MDRNTEKKSGHLRLTVYIPSLKQLQTYLEKETLKQMQQRGVLVDEEVDKDTEPLVFLPGQIVLDESNSFKRGKFDRKDTIFLNESDGLLEVPRLLKDYVGGTLSATTDAEMTLRVRGFCKSIAKSINILGEEY